ncbi:MAG: Gfo/Idh/MocA family oxidoreductase [Micropepsaceae bacterium]
MADRITREASLSARRVMLVGGGRWGRVHAGVLTQILPQGSEVLWVSRHNREAAASFAAGKTGQTSIAMVADIEQALKRKPDAAIIVTAAHTHAAMARAALENGVPALVEKPFVLTRQDADDLIALARAKSILLGVGLHLLFASYLRHFRSLWRERIVVGAQIAWLDCETEARYGETKRADPSTPKVHDVYPHLWAVMHVLWPGQTPSVRDVESLPGGGARLHLVDLA